MNAIHIIAPYRLLGMWVFDDARRGIVNEPFVGGADTLIDRLVADIPHAESGFVLVFSQFYFPGAQLRLSRLRVERGGTVYLADQLQHEAWLCPALLAYFDTPPETLFAQLRVKPDA